MKLKLACLMLALAASGMAQRVVGPPGVQAAVQKLGQQTGQPGTGTSAAQAGSTGQPQTGTGEQSKSGETKTLTNPGKRRDPFLSPIKEKSERPPCTAGKSCLPVAEVTLKGIVHTVNGDIAWVVNPENRAYFLRLNDPVMDGVLVKINKDSIVFRENSRDIMGRPATREVVKRLGTS